MSDLFDVADAVIREAYPGDTLGFWGAVRIPNFGILRGAIVKAIHKASKDGEAKPLRFRTGPVPEGLEVFYRWNVDNLGFVIGIGQGYGYGDIQDKDSFIKHEYAEWLPLSEILALVEG